MSFSGKKFRRTRCENIDEMMRESNASERTIELLKSSAPVFYFTRISDTQFTFHIELVDRVMTNTFTLGQEMELERLDGTKVKVTYELEGDDVLIQQIKQPDGKVAYFRREFRDNETKMIITLVGSTKQAVIYYELVE